jgi:hypothetical protein
MRYSRILVGALAMVGMSGLCRATPLDLTFDKVLLGTDLQITVQAHTNANGPVGFIQVSGDAGEYLWTENSGTPQIGTLQTSGAYAGQYTFNTFCIELTQDIVPGTTYTNPAYTVEPLSTAPDPNGPGVDENYGPMGAAAATELSQLYAQDLGGVNSNLTAAEFQVAVWDIIYGQQYLSLMDLDVSNINGSDHQYQMTMGNTIAAAAASLLSGLKSSPTASVAALENGQDQDQLISVPVPLPSTALTGCALFGGLGIFWIVRGRKNVASL